MEQEMAIVTKYVHQIEMELRDTLRFDEMGIMDEFVKKVEESISKTQRIQVMDVMMKRTPMQWWVTHKENLKYWPKIVRCLEARFKPLNDLKLRNWYKGIEDPHRHVWHYEERWRDNKDGETHKSLRSSGGINLFTHQTWYQGLGTYMKRQEDKLSNGVKLEKHPTIHLHLLQNNLL